MFLGLVAGWIQQEALLLVEVHYLRHGANPGHRKAILLSRLLFLVEHLKLAGHRWHVLFPAPIAIKATGQKVCPFGRQPPVAGMKQLSLDARFRPPTDMAGISKAMPVQDGPVSAKR